MELLIVGFHRSGTSLLTQLLHSAGLFVGDDLLGALPTNPYGHFEDRDVLALHREILADHQLGWQVDRPQLFHLSATHWQRLELFIAKRQAAHACWGFKDPRTCLFLGVWRHLLPDAKFVIVYRDPSECVRSMASRHATAIFDDAGPVHWHRRFFTEPDHGLKVWNTYNRAVLDFARGSLDDCLVVSYDQLTSGYPVVSAINDRLGFDLDELPTATVFDPSVVGRRDGPLLVHRPEVARRAEAIWHEFDQLARRTGGLP